LLVPQSSTAHCPDFCIHTMLKSGRLRFSELALMALWATSNSRETSHGLVTPLTR